MTTEDAASGSLAGHAAQLAARARETALCLDFDGTLSPIVDDPEAARPLAGVVELLGPLAARFAAVALVADRPADYLAEHASRRACAIWGCTGLQERHCCVRGDRLRAERLPSVSGWLVPPLMVEVLALTVG